MFRKTGFKVHHVERSVIILHAWHTLCVRQWAGVMIERCGGWRGGPCEHDY